MDGHLSALINDAQSVGRLVCPNPDCNVLAEEYEVENLVSAAQYAKYLEFVALQSLKKEKDMRWCPNKACAQPIIWDEKEKKVVCPACKTEFCFSCGLMWHEGACGQQQQDAAPAGDGQPMSEQESLNAWLKEKGAKVKPCPCCKYGIEKNDGCNHMTCQQCEHQWCWLCCGPYQGKYQNGHFADEESPCFNFQFEAADSLEEALRNHGREGDIERLLGVAQELVDEFDKTNTPEEREKRRVELEMRREQEVVEQERQRRRRRRKRMKKAALITVLSPVIVVGGVALLGGLVIASPFLLVRSIVR